jgi:hypothetical protein
MKLCDFLDRFANQPQISNFVKIRPVGAELFHAEEVMAVTKLVAAFHNFANAAKNGTWQG